MMMTTRPNVVRVGGVGENDMGKGSRKRRLAAGVMPAASLLSCLKPQASRGVSGFTLQFITNTDKFPPFNCLRKKLSRVLT